MFEHRAWLVDPSIHNAFTKILQYLWKGRNVYFFRCPHRRRCVTKEYGNQNRIYRCRRLASTFACPNFTGLSLVEIPEAAEKFRQLFVTHQKAAERTWIDFYHELNTYFNGWIDGLKIDTFKKLSDLIITDQLKRKTPFEFKEYYLDEWANMNSPVQLAEKLEEFEEFKRTLKQKSSSPFVKKQEYKFTERITGIGEAQVTTIGSFEQEFKIDDENYSLTWHVVPTDKLEFEAVIGSDLFGNKHR
ncbi:homeotic protein female sterile [Trichonephila clavipes]|nr:homeotic protein female sterile [Trichonephila clavipes]